MQFNCLPECCLDGSCQSPDIIVVKSTRWPRWHDMSPVQSFICVNIADTGNECLVEKQRFDRPASTFQDSTQVLGAEALLKGLRAEFAPVFLPVAGFEHEGLAESSGIVK